jgi:preprotein translocase subunit YajC
MRLIVGSFTALALAFAAPIGGAASAQAQAAITVGMPVTDASGAAVGTVASIQGANLLIKTDRHEALLPRSSFSVSGGKLLFGMTQAQLDSEIEKNLAAANAAIAAGATVKGVGGEQVGTIESVADGKATIALQDGKKIAVPQEGLRGNADGSVTIGYSAAQLEAMVQGAATATDANSSAAAPPANTPGK